MGRHWRGDVVVVALDASKEITDYALEWAIRNVIKVGDKLILLALLPSSPVGANRHNHSGIHHFLSSLLNWSSWHEKVSSNQASIGSRDDHGAHKINEVCMHMINQLCATNHVKQVETHVKIVADAQMGAVATKAQELGAAWVILDRRLKKEGDFCLKQLECNIILIDHAIPKIIRLVNSQSEPSVEINPRELHQEPSAVNIHDVFGISRSNSKGTTPLSSLGLDSQSSNTDESDSPSSKGRDDDDQQQQQQPQASPPAVVANYQLPKAASISSQNTDLYPGQWRITAMPGPTASRAKSQELKRISNFDIDDQFRNPSLPHSTGHRARSLELRLTRKFSGDGLHRRPATSQSTTNRATSQVLKRVIKLEDDSRPMPQRNFVDYSARRSICVKQYEKPPKSPAPARRSTDSVRPRQHLDGPDRSNAPMISRQRTSRREMKQAEVVTATSSNSPTKNASIDRISSIRRAISLSIKQPPTPPPLCSVCKHNAPIFGKPPRKFSYDEIVAATDGFSSANFLAEGGYGPVYKGVLPDGQVVAVKQHKMASAQGASEFCAEVEVLSCAQHRNLVMLVGYCMEKEWLLVYEFSCNGSLNKHLYGKNSKEVMAWHNRMKVAIGAARGLRYLHEDCRLGCIVHRDLRPNNILLTHDFEPMVGDFGLARWQVDGTLAEETRVVGTLGYLAPEYTRTGQITEKADVYAYGVLLMELISGQKAIDFSRSHGQQYLLEWARPLVKKKLAHEMIDPRLDGDYVSQEVESMMHAASLCILSDPEKRPRMSKVLRILEGDVLNDFVPHGHAPSMPHRSSVSSETTIKTRAIQRSLEMRGAQLGVDSISNERYMPSQNENLLSEEFQAYLQGSLAEFIQKMNLKDDEDERAVALYGDGYGQTATTQISKTGITSM